MTIEKRSNEVADERSEVRTPAFWRVVKYDVDDVRIFYASQPAWTSSPQMSVCFGSLQNAKDVAFSYGGKVVPVYHRVVRKPKGHGVGWAVARLKEGKRVRRRGWGGSPSSDYVQLVLGQLMINGGTPYETWGGDLLGQDWELAE